MYEKGRYLLSGDKGIVVEFGNEISEAVNKKVRNMYLAVRESRITGIQEIIPTYRSLLVNYEPMLLSVDELTEKLVEIENSLDSIELPEPRIIELPVAYGGEFGEDLGFVAEYNGISEAEVIRIHSSVDYLIYMLGFAPGFPYLGGMSERIEAPRLLTPRTRIPAGSVGIAGKQTGVYPIEAPGGWRLIGRTPVRLYDPGRRTPVILRAGDRIRFIPVDKREYEKLCRLAEKDRYRIKTTAE